MTVSDPLAAPDAQCRLIFRDSSRTLISPGPGKYRGRIDLRSVRSPLRGEYLAGTKIGELSGIFLDIPFSYRRDALQLASVVPEIPGKIIYERRNGEMLDEPVTCTRIVKDTEVPLLKAQDVPYTGNTTACLTRKKKR
jgi:hypothetical protein